MKIEVYRFDHRRPGDWRTLMDPVLMGRTVVADDAEALRVREAWEREEPLAEGSYYVVYDADGTWHRMITEAE